MSSQTACRLQKLKQLRLQKIFNEPCASRRVNKLNPCICEADSNTQVGNRAAQNAGFTSPYFASAVGLVFLKMIQPQTLGLFQENTSLKMQATVSGSISDMC